MNPSTEAPIHRSPLRFLRAVPIWVWVLAALGGIAGALLAEPGNFWGNTVPSVLTFLVAGLLVGLVAWGIASAMRR